MKTSSKFTCYWAMYCVGSDLRLSPRARKTCHNVNLINLTLSNASYRMNTHAINHVTYFTDVTFMLWLKIKRVWHRPNCHGCVFISILFRSCLWRNNILVVREYLCISILGNVYTQNAENASWCLYDAIRSNVETIDCLVAKTLYVRRALHMPQMQLQSPRCTSHGHSPCVVCFCGTRPEVNAIVRLGVRTSPRLQ